MKSTKADLLKIAAKMFAQRGFDGVSTRDLARQAKVNLCSIHYYFGSKQNLYEAVIDGVIDVILSKFAVPPENDNTGVLPPREEIRFLIGRFFDFLCRDGISNLEAALLINEIVSPSAAYDKLYARVLEPMHKRMSRLIALELGLAQEDEKVVLLAHTMFGQAVMFRIHREALLRRMNMKKFTPELMRHAQEILGQNCEAILDRAKEG